MPVTKHGALTVALKKGAQTAVLKLIHCLLV